MKVKAQTPGGIDLLAQYLTEQGIEDFVERCFNQFGQPFKTLQAEKIAGAIFFDIETVDGEVHTIAA